MGDLTALPYIWLDLRGPSSKGREGKERKRKKGKEMEGEGKE